MLKVVAKSVLLGVAVTVVAVALISGQVKKPPDPLADWVYPKAKRDLGETWERPLPWAVFTTTDPFDKVWEFYWQKKITNWGMPIKPQAGASLHTAITSPTGQESISLAYVYDPKGKKWSVSNSAGEGNNPHHHRATSETDKNCGDCGYALRTPLSFLVKGKFLRLGRSLNLWKVKFVGKRLILSIFCPFPYLVLRWQLSSVSSTDKKFVARTVLIALAKFGLNFVEQVAARNFWNDFPRHRHLSVL